MENINIFDELPMVEVVAAVPNQEESVPEANHNTTPDIAINDETSEPALADNDHDIDLNLLSLFSNNLTAITKMRAKPKKSKQKSKILKKAKNLLVKPKSAKTKTKRVSPKKVSKKPKSSVPTNLRKTKPTKKSKISKKQIKKAAKKQLKKGLTKLKSTKSNLNAVPSTSKASNDTTTATPKKTTQAGPSVPKVKSTSSMRKPKLTKASRKIVKLASQQTKSTRPVYNLMSSIFTESRYKDVAEMENDFKQQIKSRRH